MQTYDVTCLKCQASRRIQVYKDQTGDDVVKWMESSTPMAMIISARKRLDNQWGFQCMCGNNDIMTTQERDSFSDPVDPSPREIAELVKNLKPDKPAFKMAVA